MHEKNYVPLLQGGYEQHLVCILDWTLLDIIFSTALIAQASSQNACYLSKMPCNTKAKSINLENSLAFRASTTVIRNTKLKHSQE